MTQPANGTTLELKRIVRMLETTVEMAQDAELTGSLAEKSAAAVRSYNTTVNHLISTGQIPTALFSSLPADANLTDVAMTSAQLAEYLRAGLPEEEQVRSIGSKIERNFSIGVLQLGGGDKDELSQMIRDHLAEYFGEPKPSATPDEAENPAAEAAPAGAANPEPAAGTRRAALPSQARVEELRPDGQPADARRQ
jgi:hypothetical protein